MHFSTSTFSFYFAINKRSFACSTNSKGLKLWEWEFLLTDSKPIFHMSHFAPISTIPPMYRPYTIGNWSENVFLSIGIGSHDRPGMPSRGWSTLPSIYFIPTCSLLPSIRLLFWHKDVPILICFHVNINVTRERCPYSRSCKLNGYPDERAFA